MFNFFNKKIMIVTVVTIIIIIMMGITNGGRTNITYAESKIGNVITPMQKFFLLGSNFIYDFLEPITRIWKLDEEIDTLKEENKRLQNEIIQIQLTRKEYNDLRELREALNYVERNTITDYVSCNVVAKDPGNWFNIFTIDVGTNEGINKNSAVMNSDGLIGIVYEAGENWSKVISIIDNRSRVSFKILNDTTQNIGIVNGIGQDDLSGYLIDPQSQVNIGDKIITSGLGLYPEGILIGDVVDVIVKKDELLKSVIVKPSVDFKKLDRVFVIPSSDILITKE